MQRANSRFLGIGFCAVLILAGCATPQPSVTKRYAKPIFSPKEHWTGERSVRASLFTLPKPDAPPSAKSPFDLNREAQAEYLRLLISANKNDPEKVRHALGEPIKPSPKAGQDETRIRFERRLVFSLQKENFRPGDRIDATWLTIKIEPQCANFVSWSRFESDRKTIDLGKLTASQSREASITAGASIPVMGLPISLSTTAAQKSGLTEELALGKELLTLAGYLERDQATLIQQGAPQIDLAGTLIVDMTIEVPETGREKLDLVSFGEMFDKGAAKPAKKLTPIFQPVVFPNACSDITAGLTYTYVIRRVNEGDDTVNESDDTAEYLLKKVETPVSVTLVPHESMRLFVWKVGDQKKKDYFLWNVNEDSQRPIMYFSSYEAAADFLKWAKRQDKSIRQIAGIEIFPPNSPPSNWTVQSFEMTRKPI